MSSSGCVSYFADAGPFGTLQLAVQYKTEQLSAVGVLLDAMLLSATEPLTRSFEDLIHRPIEWQSTHRLSAVSEWPELSLTMRFINSCVVSTASLTLSSQKLLQLKRWVAPLGGDISHCEWHRVQVSLYLSVMQLSDEEKCSLEHGALVMIPESFKPRWQASLHLGDHEFKGCYQPQDDSWVAVEDQNSQARTNGDPESGSQFSEAATQAETQTLQGARLCIDCQLDPFDLLREGACVTQVLANSDDDSCSATSLYLQTSTGESFRAHVLSLGAGRAALLEKMQSTAA